MNKDGKKNSFKKFTAVLVASTMLALGFTQGNPVQANVEPTVYEADNSTKTQYTELLNDSTLHTGRIWVDKTVEKGKTEYKDSGPDFNVTLSAMSSANNINKKVAVSQPLDIVMVLDVSGSMADRMDPNQDENTKYEYVEVDPNQMDKKKTYYIQQTDSYKGIKYNSKEKEWGYYNFIIWTPVDTSKTTVYEKVKVTGTNPKKIDALKTATSSFLDKVEEENKRATSNDQKHRVSVIKFADDSYGTDDKNTTNNSGYNHTQAIVTFKEDQYCEGENKQKIVKEIKSIEAAGATSADYGFEKAKQQIKEARPEAKKVVIFFTDGEPNHNTGFSEKVANETVRLSKDLKATGVDVYSIAVFASADPTVVPPEENFDQYMQGVSSNYKKATSYTKLNERTEDGDYYLKATDQEGLVKIFEQILEDQKAPSGFATETDVNHPEKSGYVTFTDTLGKFMEVDTSNMGVFYDGKKISTGVIQDGKKYTFSGTFKTNWKDDHGQQKEYSLNNLLMDIKTNEEGQQVVTLKVPAALLPVWWSDVTDGVATSTAASPIQVVYPVSLSQDVQTQIETGNLSDELKAYVDQNGTASFYSNEYVSSQTKASYTPNRMNDYYYYSEDTILYIDDEVDENGHLIHKVNYTSNLSGTFYVEKEYYTPEGVKVVHGPITVGKDASNDFTSADIQKNEKGNAVVPAGTTRVRLIKELNRDKSENVTDTLTKSANRVWNQKDIEVTLGNNGKITYQMPGTLEVSKVVASTNENLDFSQKEFEFTLSLKQENQEISDAYTIEYVDANGKALDDLTENQKKSNSIQSGGKFYLKKDQKARIQGIPSGVQYVVTETQANGYVASPNVVQSGMVDSNEISSVVFTNTFKPAPVVIDEDAETAIRVHKSITGRESADAFGWVDTAEDSFTFTLSVTDEKGKPTNHVHIEKDRVVIDSSDKTNEYTESFGKITIDQAGKYVFTISEEKPDVNKGFAKAPAKQTVVVSVTDNPLTGKMDVSFDSSSTTFNFVNEYKAKDVAIGKDTDTALSVQKILENRAWKADDTFTFTMSQSSGKTVALPDPIMMKGLDVLENEKNASKEFGKIVFEEAGTYEFVVTETMENAPGVHAEEESQTMKVIVTDDGKGQLVAQVENANLTFTNVYEAEDVDVDPNTENESDPVEAVAGFKKVLTGRNWAKDESFTFELVDVTGKSEKIIDSKVATQAQPVVQFENLTYTLDMLSGKSSKTFKYEVREQKPDGGVKDGLTYSSNVAKFEVTVKDAGQGQLTASLKSTGGSHVFANAYEAKSVVLKDCLQVTKKLTGREWKDSDRFTFRLEPIETYEDGSFEWSKTECTISSENVDHKASFGNVTFFKPSPKGGYQFKVVEVIPNDDTKGMSYQSTPERITFKVTDDGEGQLHASVDKSKTDDLIFENTYSASDLVIDPTQDPDGEGTVGIQLEKVLTGREWKDGDSFLFEIEPLDGAPATTKSECTITGPHQKFDFGVLRITKEDMKGESRKEFRYKVSEVIPENPILGITYESDPIIFKVLVTDNGEGFLVAGDGTPDSGLVINVKDGSNKGMFTNVYVPAKGVLDGSKNLAVTKQIEGRDWLDSDTFTFTLKANKEYEGVTLPESLEVTVSKENRAASFGDITFTKEGTYEFTIHESSKAKNGMTNAADQTITIVVEDNLNGKLVAKVKEGSALMPFVNKYAPEKGTDVDPNKADAQVDGFKKVLTGRDWAKDEQFQFALKDESGKVLQTITVDEENPIAKFDKLVYGADVLEGAQSKEFKYTIEEVAPKQDENGIQYDRHKVHLTVTVKDMKDGTLKASVTQKGSHEFTNVYDAKDVDVDPNTENGSDPVEVVAGFKKVLTGRDWTKDESFTFELVDVTGDSKEVIESKKATKSQPIVQFNSLTYSKDMLDGKSSKIFKYEVREQKPDGGVKDGLTYSNNVAQFEVTVKDAGQGQLSASLKSTDGSHVFENVYVPGNVPVDPTLDPDSTQTGVGLPFEKVLEGRNWKGSDAFEFELIALDEGAPMPENSVVTITGPKQKFDFGTIVFDADDMKSGYDVVEGSSIRTKDFHYQVVELPGLIPGIQYDANRPIEFTITVVDDGSGQLSAKVAKKDINGSTKFSNVFDASRKFEGEDSGLRIVKVLEGHDMSVDQFAFDVVAQSKDAAEKIGKKEKGDSIVVSSGVAVAANTKAVMIPFENMEFDGYDIDKEFEYVVKEQLKDVAGYTYDKSEHVVKIVVQEQKDGTLLPVTYVDGKLVEGIANVVFNNVFEASGTLNGDGHVNIEATKTLSGRNMDEGEFRFDVINVSNGVVVSQGRNLMAANGDVAKIVFDPIEYDMVMLTKDAAEGFASHELGSNVYSYQYKVVEDSSDFAGRGISAVTPSMNVVVNVKVMEDASLDFEVVYPEQSGGLAFKNNYNTDVVSVDVNGSKRLTVPENSSMSLEDIAGQYQFVIEALEPSYIPEEVVDPMVEVSEGVEEVDEVKEVEASEEMDSKDVVEDVPSVMMVNSVKGSDYLPAKTSATNDAAGNVHFGTIQFDQSALNGVQEGEDGCRTITFNYVVSEVGQLPGITNDGNKQFSIVVTDDGKGGLTAALVGDVAFEFNNTYAVSSVSSCITDQVRLNKVLTGRELLANEFVFRMEEVNGSRFAEGTNDAKGNVVMGPIAFDKAGEYEFRVFEKDTSNNVMNGISYDGAVYDVSAIVTDNKDGTLRVEWDAHGLDSIEFKNEYVAKSTSYTFGAMKVLSGRDLMADEFEFVLKNLKGQVVDSAKNDKDGFVQFDSIEFKKPGTYTYTLSEVKGDVKDVTYDDHEYKVVLEVVDNGKGNLEVVRQDDAKIVFKNLYVKSEVPKKPESPKKDSNTGLATNVSSWMSLMAISGTALVGISYRKRKSNKK